MKKTLLVLLIASVSFVSCSTKKEVTQTKDISKETYKTEDLSKEYDFENGTLDLYFNIDDDVPYVDLVDYINSFKGTMNETLKVEEESNSVSVKYQSDVDDELKQFYRDDTVNYELTFDFDKNQITMNTIDFILSTNKETKTNFFEGLKYVDLKYTDPQAITIDLNKYDILTKVYDNQKLIPFYLATYLFSGYGFETYFNEDKIYGFDVYQEETDYSKIFEGKNNSVSKTMLESTQNFMALVFDYTYGLKGFKNIKSFDQVLDTYELKNSKNANDLHTKVSKFLFSFNDLHTSPVKGGYRDPSYFPDFSLSNKIKNFFTAAKDNQCTFTNESLVSYSSLDDTTGYIEINGFDVEIKNKVEEAMNQFKNKKNIVFDLRCNTGGILGTIYHPLKFMTNDGVPFNFAQPIDQSSSTTFTKADTNYFQNKKYYVVTSFVTYSAANAFTSVVKDNNYATIIGTKSGGGAGILYTVTLPDGMIVTLSGPSIIIDKNNNAVEDGVDVDIPLELHADSNIKNEILKIIQSNN